MTGLVIEAIQKIASGYSGIVWHSHESRRDANRRPCRSGRSPQRRPRRRRIDLRLLRAIRKSRLREARVLPDRSPAGVVRAAAVARDNINSVARRRCRRFIPAVPFRLRESEGRRPKRWTSLGRLLSATSPCNQKPADLIIRAGTCQSARGDSSDEAVLSRIMIARGTYEFNVHWPPIQMQVFATEHRRMYNGCRIWVE